VVLQKQKEGARTCRFSVDLQNGKHNMTHVNLVLYLILYSDKKFL